MTNQEKMIKLISELLDNNTDKFFAIGGDYIRVTNNGTTLEILFDKGDSDIVLECKNQILR